MRENLKEKRSTRVETRPNVEKERMLQSAEQLALEIVNQWPQVSDKGNVQYYFAGSLSTMLIARAGKIRHLDDQQFPRPVATGEQELPEEAKVALTEFARQIGDLDFVKTDVPDDPWIDRMKKGGGGPVFDELSAEARVVCDEDGQDKMMCDPVQAVVRHSAVAVEFDGREVYCSSPAATLAYKFTHLGQSFGSANKSERFVSDTQSLLEAFPYITDMDEAANMTREVIRAYNASNPSNVVIPYYHPDATREMIDFFERAARTDENAGYLEDFEGKKEYAFGMLQVLAQYDSDEAKARVVQAMNRHRGLIELERPNSSSSVNRKLVAEFLFSREELPPEAVRYFDVEPTVQEIEEWLEVHVWAIPAYIEYVDEKQVENIPAGAPILKPFMCLREDCIEQDIAGLDAILNATEEDISFCLHYIADILKTEYAQEASARGALIQIVKAAVAKFGEKVSRFLGRLERCLTGDEVYINRKRVRVDTDNRGVTVRELLIAEGLSAELLPVT